MRQARIASVVSLVGTLALAPIPGASQTGMPGLPDEVARLARELERVERLPADGGEPPTGSPADPDAPVSALRTAQDDARDLLRAAKRPSARALRAALRHIEEAWRLFAAGSPDLTHLGQTADALKRAEIALKVGSRTSGPDARGPIAALQAKLADVAEELAFGVVLRAEAAGVHPPRLTAAHRLLELGDLAAERGDYDVAVVHFGGAMKVAANTIVFDIELFEQNIIDSLAGQTVGHAFSIAYQTQLFEGGESSGLARTAADAPSTAQSPNKEMHVASVSKTLTGIVVQRLLDELGLTPDAFLAPYLPSNWTLGAGVEALRFADFMKHESGFGQIGAGNSYENLRTAIASPVGLTTFDYNNANFGLMRVLVAGLLGIDPVDFPEFGADTLTAAAFLIYADSVYSSIGVDVGCASVDGAPTIQYNFPDAGTDPGYLEPDRQLTCGGIGWFISSNELASVLTHLRNTEDLLSAQARATMQGEFLGLMDPANYGCGSGLSSSSPRICGELGVYYMHGGDWNHGPGELHACAAAFPIQLEVGLVINSERGFTPYQCNLLQTAFHDAWVSN